MHIRNTVTDKPVGKAEPTSPVNVAFIGFEHTEDLTRPKKRSTGYVGGNSEILCLQRLWQQNVAEVEGKNTQCNIAGITSAQTPADMFAEEALQEASTSPAQLEDCVTIAKLGYHLDDLTGAVPNPVAAYDFPDSDTAYKLFNTYMIRVHASFPVVGARNISNQLHEYLCEPSHVPPTKVLAVMNLIFAISAHYLYQSKADIGYSDHSKYMSRARLLSMTSETIFQHPDLQQIQVLGLYGFYFLCVGQINRSLYRNHSSQTWWLTINRSWNMVGMAIRRSIALGLNLRNSSAALTSSAKEIRYRLWWALYTLENRLCSMTGRVSCIAEHQCSTPLPVPLEEEEFETDCGRILLAMDRPPWHTTHDFTVDRSYPYYTLSSVSTTYSQGELPNCLPQQSRRDGQMPKFMVGPKSSLYFVQLLELSKIAKCTFERLYAPVSLDDTPANIKKEMQELTAVLSRWHCQLPEVFEFQRAQTCSAFYEYQLNLGAIYYATKMSIYRPCLRHLFSALSVCTPVSAEFDQNAVAACVEAAIELIDLLHVWHNSINMMTNGHHWNILHCLVQAVSVLLMQISLSANDVHGVRDASLASIKKALLCLSDLGERSPSAFRARVLCSTILNATIGRITCSYEAMDGEQP